jgi:Zn-dependent protease with chaperone function
MARSYTSLEFHAGTAPMNFFERQADARRASRRLVILFILAVIGIVATIDLVVLFALGFNDPDRLGAGRGMFAQASQHGGLLLVTSLGTLAVIGLASLFRMSSLRAGGASIARELGGSQVDEDTRDPQLRRLRNVVEEIAIAASVPVPAIFVLEEEQGINAFAAGYSPNDAAIAVTRGTLERLNRDELQGVIAHEFSHILNGDMRLNVRLIGVLFGILVLGIIGRKILYHSRGSRDSKNAGAIMAIALALFVVGYVGVFFGRLIKAGISRSREYLADASAVQFTRQTSGIAGALKKIAGVDEGSKLAAADTEEVAHMLFGDGVGYSALWATHPPLLERIKALDPSFNPKTMAELKQRYRANPPSGLAEDRALGLNDGAPLAAIDRSAPLLPPAAASVALTPGRVAAHAGQPERADFAAAGRIHDELPPALLDAAHSHEQSIALVLALLLDDDRAIRARQLAEVAQRIDEETAEATARLGDAVAALHPLLRLPLASLAFPALRRRPRPQLDRLLDCTHTLIHIDGKVGLFEYCLGRLLRQQVIEALDPSRHRPNGRRKLTQCRAALADLFAVLAAHGHGDRGEAQRAFSAGVQTVLPYIGVDYRPPADWVAALDRALDQLDDLEPMGKQLLVEGLSTTSSHDGRVTVAEAELLRTICACLHCPLPPMLAAA